MPPTRRPAPRRRPRPPTSAARRSSTSLAPGKYIVQVESIGFETTQITDINVRRGRQEKRDVALADRRLRRGGRGHARQDRREHQRQLLDGADARSRSTRCPTMKTRWPSSCEQMAGPGAVLRVNGFSGGRLPPKSQIAEIRFRFDPYSAENHEAGFPRVDIRTRPGNGNWRNNASFTFRDESLNARNAFAAEKRAEQARRYQWSMDGPIKKGKTSFSLNVGGMDSFDTETIRTAQRRRHAVRRRRLASRPIASTSTPASSTRSTRTRCCASSTSRNSQRPAQPRRRRLRPVRSRLRRARAAATRSASRRAARSSARCATKCASRSTGTTAMSTSRERRRDDPRAGRVHERRRAGRRRPARRRPSSSPTTSTSRSARSTRCAPASSSRAARIAATRRATTTAPTRSPRPTAFAGRPGAAVLAAHRQSARRVSGRSSSAPTCRTTSACRRT